MNIKANTDIRAKAMMNGIMLCEVADELGILDSAFSRKLRKELPEQEKKRFLK